MTVSRPVVAALAIMLTWCGAVAVAKTSVFPPPFEPKDEAAARHIRLLNQAIDLINKADAHVYATVAGCKPSFPHGSATPTHDAPTQPVLDALAPLRRPATPAELQADVPGVGFGGETYVDYIRNVTAANGTELTIVIGRSVRVFYRPSKRCLDAEHARLVHLLKGKPKVLRSTALGEFGKLRHGQEQSAKQPATPQDGIYLFGHGGGGGGASIADFRKRGVFGSSGGGSNRSEPSSRLNGLLPDGVASVTLEYPKKVSRGPYYKPTVYPHAFTRTVQVQNNVISVAIPRDAGDAFPRRMVWRDAADNVVHTFTQSSS